MIKRILSCILIAAIVIVSSVSVVFAAGNTISTVSTASTRYWKNYYPIDNLNMRRGPGTSYGVVTVISAGATVGVDIETQNNAWCYACYHPSTYYEGYVSRNYLAPGEEVYEVTASSLNMRSKASLSSTAIASLPCGTRVRWFSISSYNSADNITWYYVTVISGPNLGLKGYVAEQYLYSLRYT